MNPWKHRELDVGDCRRAVADWGRLRDSSDPRDQAYVMALEAKFWLMDVPGGRIPSIERASEFLATAAPEVAHEIVSASVLASALNLDRQSLLAWASLCQGTASVPLRSYGLILGWLSVFDGVSTPMADHIQSARACGDASTLVQATALQAMQQLALGQRQEATKTARRASRMAKTESLPQAQYLAGLALARVRRHQGSPHLCLHILTGLRRSAPTPWHNWLDAERVLAGDDDVTTPFAQPLLELKRAAIIGVRDRTEAASARVLSRFSNTMLHAETRFLASALDPYTIASEAGGDWIRGESPAVPFGLHALGEDAQNRIAYVGVFQNGATRRALAAGVALLSSIATLTESKRPRVRTETALAVLAFAAGRRMNQERFFLTVYGFGYDEAHKTTLDALLHRMRDALGGAGTVVHKSGEVFLQSNVDFVLADPRCEQPMEDRLLRHIAKEGGLSARSLSGQLQIPLRTVQEALRELTESGMCIQQREGRSIKYEVEDTTFTEPTQYS